MLLSTYVRTNIGSRNLKYYNSKGYQCKFGDNILVSVEDMRLTSHASVLVMCTVCKTINDMDYITYLSNINSTEIHDYYCIHCKDVKKKELANRKQLVGQLTRNNNYYWIYKENILKELQEYINKHDGINEISLKDIQLYRAIIKCNHNVEDLIKELGYSIEDVYHNKPRHYYDKLENLVSTIQLFIDKHGKFPSQNEIIFEIGIYSAHVYKHFNSINELKKYMDYNDKKDLIDHRGDSNRSLYELYVANYLIAQGLSDNYQREQYPFKELESEIIPYRSDFTLYPEGKKVIHVEVWGDKSGGRGQLFENYCRVRQLKEEQYTKYGEEFDLINIEPEVFVGTYDKIEHNLHDIFKDILPLKFNRINIDSLLPLHKFNERELFDELMSYSDDKNYLPKGTDLLISYNGGCLIRYVDNKYGGLSYFADKYNVKMVDRQNNYWDDQKVFDCFDYLIDTYGKIVSYKASKELKDDNIQGLFHRIQNSGGLVSLKLKYIYYCFENNKVVKDDLIKYLHDSSINKLNGVKNVAPELIELAKQILKNTIIINNVQVYNYLKSQV